MQVEILEERSAAVETLHDQPIMPSGTIDDLPIPASALAPVLGVIATFSETVAVHVPKPGLILLSDGTWSESEYREHCRSTKVFLNWGVYLHIAEDGEVLYVGKAVSQNPKGPMHECWNIQLRENNSSSVPLPRRRWILTAVLPIDSRYAWLLPALESLFIAMLQPQFNTDAKHLPAPSDRTRPYRRG